MILLFFLLFFLSVLLGSKLPQTVGDFIPPDEHTKYLLNLLADDRVLTVEELDKVMKYLQERRARLLAKNGKLTC